MSPEVDDGRRGSVTNRGGLVPPDFHRRVLGRARQILVPLVVIVVAWYAAAQLVANPNQLPSPGATFAQVVEIITVEDFRQRTALDHLWLTLQRAFISSSIALVVAMVGGILMSTNDLVEDSVSNWLPFWMTTPTVVIILLSMVWFNFSELSVIFAVAVASTPFGMVNMWEGSKDVDVDLLTMADAFDASTWMVWRHIYVPHLLPYLFGSYRYILGMVWKMVVLAEVFGLSAGIGAMFRYYFDQGVLVMVIAYLVPFIVVVLTIEYGVLKPLETYLFRWRN